MSWQCWEGSAPARKVRGADWLRQGRGNGKTGPAEERDRCSMDRMTGWGVEEADALAVGTTESTEMPLSMWEEGK